VRHAHVVVRHAVVGDGQRFDRTETFAKRAILLDELG
jgi:hypothetical protein